MLSAANPRHRRAQVVAPIRPFMTYRCPGSTTFRLESFSFFIAPFYSRFPLVRPAVGGTGTFFFTQPRLT